MNLYGPETPDEIEDTPFTLADLEDKTFRDNLRKAGYHREITRLEFFRDQGDHLTCVHYKRGAMMLALAILDRKANEF